MSKKIQFLDHERRSDGARNCVILPALVDGERVVCVVSARLLEERFHALTGSPWQLTKAYESAEPAIREAARQLIEAGRVNDKGEVLVTTETYR